MMFCWFSSFCFVYRFCWRFYSSKARIYPRTRNRCGAVSLRRPTIDMWYIVYMRIYICLTRRLLEMICFCLWLTSRWCVHHQIRWGYYLAFCAAIPWANDNITSRSESTIWYVSGVEGRIHKWNEGGCRTSYENNKRLLCRVSRRRRRRRQHTLNAFGGRARFRATRCVGYGHFVGHPHSNIQKLNLCPFLCGALCMPWNGVGCIYLRNYERRDWLISF